MSPLSRAWVSDPFNKRLLSIVIRRTEESESVREKRAKLERKAAEALKAAGLALEQARELGDQAKKSSWLSRQASDMARRIEASTSLGAAEFERAKREAKEELESIEYEYDRLIKFRTRTGDEIEASRRIDALKRGELP